MQGKTSQQVATVENHKSITRLSIEQDKGKGGCERFRILILRIKVKVKIIELIVHFHAKKFDISLL